MTSVVDLDAPSLPAIRTAHTPAAAQAPSHVTIVHQAPPPQWNRGAAIVMSFFIPGLGQMYKGQIWRGLLWMIFTTLGCMAFVFPGLILHLICIIDAAKGDPTQVVQQR